MDHQLALIEDNFRESMVRGTEVERERLAAAKHSFDELSTKRDDNVAAAEALEQESEVMMRELEEYSTKIRRFAQNTTVINQQLVPSFREFCLVAIDKVISMRNEPGSECLRAAPHKSAQSGPLAALQSKLGAIEASVKAKLAEDERLQRRGDEIGAQLPALEAAKKAAAAAKQFKEASAKTADIKRLTDEKAESAAALEAIRAECAELGTQAEALRKEKDREAAKHRAQIRAFTDTYAAGLRYALDYLAGAAPSNTAQLLYMDALPLDNAAADNSSPSSPNTAVDDDDDDAFVRAVRGYITECFEELAALLDCTVESLMQPGDVAAASESVTRTPTVGGPTLDDFPAGRGASVEEHDHAVAASQPQSPVRDGQSEPQEEPEAEPEVVQEPEVDPAVLRESIETLKRFLERAMDDEDYDECDRLQQEIDVLEAKLQ
jgi:hypothetical protein